MNFEPKKTGREGVLDLSGSGHAAMTIQPLAQRSMFWRPAWLESSPWLEHIPFAFWLIEAHQPQVFVELGTRLGVSYFAFCQAVEKLGLDTRCFAVDRWEGEAGTGGQAGFERVKAYNDAQYSAFSRLIRSSFDDALSCFSDGSIDLLHLDGLHTFEAVRHDFDAWLPKLSERAVVVMHASNLREPGCGVYRLFEQLRETYPSFELLHGDGLGVLGVGPEQNELLRSLFKSSQIGSAKRVIHEVFSRLGRGCADAFAAGRQQDELRRLKAREAEPLQPGPPGEAAAGVERLQALLGPQAEALRGAQANEQALAAQLAQLTRELAGRVEEAAAANASAREAQQKCLALHQQLIARANELAGLKRQQEEAAGERDRLRQELEEQGRQLETALAAARAGDGHLAQLREQLAGQAAELEQAEAQLGRAEASRQELERRVDLLLEEKQELILSNEERIRELATLTGLLEEREAGLADKTLKKAAHRQRAEKLEEELKAQAEALKAAEKQLAEIRAQAGTVQGQKDAVVAGLEAENRKLRSAQDALARQLGERDQEAAALAGRLEQEKTEGQAAQKEAASQRQRAERLEGELRGKAEALKTAEQQLAEARAQAGSMQARKESAIAGLEDENRRLRHEQQALARQLEERFQELAALTRMLEEQGAPAEAPPAPKGPAPGRLSVPLRDLVDTWVLPRGVKSQMSIIEQSGLFDKQWYLEQNPDVAKSGANPIKHYLRFGAAEGRNPGPAFNTSAYLARHPELVKEGINPLVHYIQQQSKA